MIEVPDYRRTVAGRLVNGERSSQQRLRFTGTVQVPQRQREIVQSDRHGGMRHTWAASVIAKARANSGNDSARPRSRSAKAGLLRVVASLGLLAPWLPHHPVQVSPVSQPPRPPPCETDTVTSDLLPVSGYRAWDRYAVGDMP
ncbi:hypothetical protein [Actinophytocola sp.]|uniref:hypothetical protein n=1 Tax=Actinophytocola sp. TaxID=1872138 RepID=UPI002ED18D41